LEQPCGRGKSGSYASSRWLLNRCARGLLESGTVWLLLGTHVTGVALKGGCMSYSWAVRHEGGIVAVRVD